MFPPAFCVWGGTCHSTSSPSPPVYSIAFRCVPPGSNEAEMMRTLVASWPVMGKGCSGIAQYTSERKSPAANIHVRSGALCLLGAQGRNRTDITRRSRIFGSLFCANYYSMLLECLEWFLVVAYACAFTNDHSFALAVEQKWSKSSVQFIHISIPAQPALMES